MSLLAAARDGRHIPMPQAKHLNTPIFDSDLIATLRASTNGNFNEFCSKQHNPKTKIGLGALARLFVVPRFRGCFRRFAACQWLARERRSPAPSVTPHGTSHHRAARKPDPASWHSRANFICKDCSRASRAIQERGPSSATLIANPIDRRCEPICRSACAPPARRAIPYPPVSPRPNTAVGRRRSNQFARNALPCPRSTCSQACGAGPQNCGSRNRAFDTVPVLFYVGTRLATAQKSTLTSIIRRRATPFPRREARALR